MSHDGCHRLAHRAAEQMIHTTVKDPEINQNAVGAIIGGAVGAIAGAFGAAATAAGGTALLSTPLAPVALHVPHFGMAILAGGTAAGAKLGSQIESGIKNFFR